MLLLFFRLHLFNSFDFSLVFEWVLLLLLQQLMYPEIFLYPLLTIVIFFLCPDPTGWQMTVALSFFFCCYFFDGTFTNSDQKKIKTFCTTTTMMTTTTTYALIVGCCHCRVQCSRRKRKKIVNEHSAVVLLFVSDFLDLLTLIYVILASNRPLYRFKTKRDFQTIESQTQQPNIKNEILKFVLHAWVWMCENKLTETKSKQNFTNKHEYVWLNRWSKKKSNKIKCHSMENIGFERKTKWSNQ